MNRLIRLSLMLLFATISCQQLQAKKHPFVMEGKKWVYAKNDGTKKITYVIHGDTVINGEAFMKFFRSENNGNSIYFGAVQEIDKMVFIVYADEVQKGLVYDFREKPDSPVTLASGLTLNVSFECKQEFDSELYNRIRYSHPPFPNGEAFIEYMSAIDGFGGMEMDLFCRDITDINYTLMECYENGEYLFNAFDTYTWTVYNWMPYACSLVKEGKVWRYQSTNAMTGYNYQYELFIEGDTLIGGEAYKKLYKDKQKYLYQGALREEGSKVYFVRSGHENIEFLYDFDLPVGETMHYGHYDATAVARDVITVKGIERKRVKVKEIQTDPDEEWSNEELTGYWVEGIGSGGELLDPARFFVGIYSDGLLAVYEDGKCIFTGGDFYMRKNPFVKEGKRWEYELTNLYYGNHYAYTMRGDTLIDAYIYKKVFESVNGGKPTYFGAIREYNGKVYMVDKSKSWDEWDMPDFETVICDFNAQVGDVVFCKEEYGDTYRLTVDRIDEVTVDGNARKRLVLKATTTHEDGSVEDRGSMEWVEGIGSTEGFSGPMGLFYDGGLYSHLIACYEYDEPVFMQEDFYGRIINGRNYELDESREHENVKYINLSLENAVVLKSQGDRIVVADRENGAAICLFGTGLEAEEGTELKGTIAGLLCECNDLSTLFPSRSTDPATVQKGGMAEGLSFEEFSVSNLRTDYNYWYKVMNILGVRIISTDQGIFVAGNDGKPYLHMNDIFGVFDGISLPMTAQTLFGCFSPRMYKNITQYSFVPLSVMKDESAGITSSSPINQHPSQVFDLQGRKMNDGNSLPKGIYIMGGRKVVVR